MSPFRLVHGSRLTQTMSMITPPPSATQAVGASLSVCITCRQRTHAAPGYIEPGRALLAALEQRLAGTEVTVRGVQCFAICNRPCTIALQASGKWSQIIAGLMLAQDVDAIVEAALIYAKTSDGVIPWGQTPMCFRRGGVARLPPPPA